MSAINLQQLWLDLLPESPPTLDNFIVGDNAMLITTFAEWLANRTPKMASQLCFYLHGENGSGKTYLLQCAQNDTPHHFIYCDVAQRDAKSVAEQNRLLAADQALALDNIGFLNAEQQTQLFHFFNRQLARCYQAAHDENAQTHPYPNQPAVKLLIADRQPPLHLAVREDLRTRLGLGQIYALKPLPSQEMLSLILKFCQQYQLDLDARCINYLLVHASRDPQQLSELFTRLHQTTLSTHRTVTLPLLRELMLS